LLYGAAKSSQRIGPSSDCATWRELLPALPLPENAAETYRMIRAELESKGEMIGKQRSLDRLSRAGCGADAGDEQ
jgi:predicted nucleic acid-binding protein